MKWPKEHPGPWKYDPDEDAEITDMPILDANGDPVVQTDAGCYPPDPETARMIVDAMNGREEVRAAMNAILATIAISDQGFMTKENALQVVENMVRDSLKKLDENEQEGDFHA